MFCTIQENDFTSFYPTRPLHGFVHKEYVYRNRENDILALIRHIIVLGAYISWKPNSKACVMYIRCISLSGQWVRRKIKHGMFR